MANQTSSNHTRHTEAKGIAYDKITKFTEILNIAIYAKKGPNAEKSRLQ